MSRPRISRNKVKAAIKGSGGIIAHISRKTGYSWGALRDYIRADEELTRMIQDEEETIDDLAESTVISAIRDKDMQTARWWLARRRRNRYGDNVDITSGGERITLVWPGMEKSDDAD